MVLAVLVSVGAASGEDALVRARQFYNERRWDAAIDAAAQARRRPELAPSADVVIGRARLERYRERQDAADLVAARATLAGVDPVRLALRDRGEWMVGMGEILFVDRMYGAAAETFDAALGYVRAGDADTRDRVLAWWAMAVDRQAQAADPSRRRSLYERMRDRLETTVRGEPVPSAGYWLAVAVFGAGDADRASDAAMAAWVVAGTVGARAAAIREDLDRLVVQRIIPERVRRSASGADAARRTAVLRAEWDEVRKAWPIR